jgi:hypothetical protein
MTPLRLRVLVGAALLSLVSIAHADVELKNDGFVSGGAASFQTGFITGEAGGSRFVASTAGRQLKKLQLLFGGAATTQTLTLRVFDDTAGTDTPGAELFMGDFQLTGSDSAIQELDLTSANVVVTAQFRVAIEFQHGGAPSIASDGDGTLTADKNFILTGGSWKKSNALGLAGDWVIRAFVDDPPPPNPNVFCDTTPECPDGEICDVPHHACISGCRTSSECSEGTCDSSGQCVAPNGGNGGGCSTGGGGGVLFGLALLAVFRRVLVGGRQRLHSR